MAGDIVADWRGGAVSFRREFLAPDAGNVYYETHKAATLDLFKSLHAGLRAIADLKLKPVLGESAEATRPRLAESLASGRSTRNVMINLTALQALYRGDDDAGLGRLVAMHGGDPGLDPLMRRAFTLTIDNAASLEHPLPEVAADRAGRDRAEKLLEQVLVLRQIVETRVATALGLQVGFNAFDGD